MAGGKSSDNCEYSIRPPAARLRQGAATPGRSLASGGRPQRDSMTGEHQGSAMRGSPGTRRESQPPDQHGGARRGAAPGMAKVAACPEASRAVALGRPSPSERPCRAIVRVACGIAPRDRRRPVARAGWPARIGNLRREEKRHKARRPCGVCNGCGRALRDSASADRRIDG